MLSAGTQLVVIVPINVSEDEEWLPGRKAEIVHAEPDGYDGKPSYEVQADGVSTVGSFAEIDLVGEYRWFDVIA